MRTRGAQDTEYSRRAELQVTVPGPSFTVYRKKKEKKKEDGLTQWKRETVASVRQQKL